MVLVGSPMKWIIPPASGVHASFDTGFKWIKLENYPVNPQTTQVKLMKGTQHNLRHWLLSK